MSTINAVNPNIDATVRVFDNFYKFEVNVPAAEYDVVYSYFLKEIQLETLHQVCFKLRQVLIFQH
jgi:hypothetical protein